MDQRGSGQAGGDPDLPVRRGQGALQAEVAPETLTVGVSDNGVTSAR